MDNADIYINRCMEERYSLYIHIYRYIFIQAEIDTFTYMRTVDIFLCMVVVVIGVVAGVLSRRNAAS